MKEQDYLEFGQMYRSLKKCCRNVRWKTSVTQYELNALKNTAKVTDTIKSGGSFKINEAIRLDRECGVKIAGKEVDKLSAVIKVVGIKGWYNAEIISREYNGIIEELNAAIEKAYAEAASNLCKQMKAGYC